MNVPTMYRKFNFVIFPHENMKKPSKVGYFSRIAEIFSTVSRPKTSPSLKFCSVKIAHCMIIIQRLWL